MGRVSRYKRIKSIDPFAKNGSWKSDVGDCATLSRTKQASKTALRMKEQKMSKLQRRMRGKNKAAGAGMKNNGGCNGWGNDDGYDLPPVGGDEFDLNDLMRSVKKQTLEPHFFLERKSDTQLASVSSSGDEKWARKVEKNDLCGVGVTDRSAQSSTNNIITAQTPTKDIIAACSNPKSKKNSNNVALSSKKEKRKAFFEKKKLNKRKRRSTSLNNADDYCNTHQRSLQSLHTQNRKQRAMKHLTKQRKYLETLVARTDMGDQVERPPKFTCLPRGANKTNQEQKKSEKKHQEALEIMREKVMKQYGILRESRRNLAM